MSPIVVLRQGLAFPEGPRIGPDGRLYYSDEYDHTVRALDLTTGEEEVVIEVAGQPAGLGWLPDGRLLVVSMVDRKVLRLEPDRTLSVHADLSGVATFHANDMLVDPSGRAYVGNFGFDLEAVLAERGPAIFSDPDWRPPTASLALVEPDGTTRVVAEDLLFPNGMALPNSGTLVVAETIGFRLTAFDVAADGALSNRRLWADLSSHQIAPDGICTDPSGDIWVATALHHKAVRVSEGGAITAHVDTTQLCNAVCRTATDLICCTAPTSTRATATENRQGRLESVPLPVPAPTS